MISTIFNQGIRARIRDFRAETGGSLSVEMMLITPLLIWALLAAFNFYDAFRKTSLAQSAAFHVADVISRKTDIVTPEYLEGMNDLFDFLAQGKFSTNLRVSAVIWDSTNQRPAIMWSYGARTMEALPIDTFEFMAAGDYQGLAEQFEGDWKKQSPNPNLPDRMPPILPGETMILVEAFALTNSVIPSFMSFGLLNEQRISPVAIIRPRFTPTINFSGTIYPFPDEDVYDEGTGINDNIAPEIIGDDPFAEEAPSLPGGVVVYDNDFTTGDRKDWSGVSDSHFMHGLPIVGSMIGPFGKDAHRSIRDEVEFEVKLDKKHNQFALVEFDLVILGNWAGYTPGATFPEGDIFFILKRDRSIATQPFHMDPTGMFSFTRKNVTPRQRSHYTTLFQPIDLNANIMGGAHSDQIWRVSILVEDPEEKFKLGFGARLFNGFPSKAYGFSNFRVTALEGKYNGNNFFPPDGDRDRDDPFDGFGYYEKCMDTRHGSKSHGVTNAELDTPLRYRVEARGHERFRNCVDFYSESGDPRISASPTLEFKYLRGGASGEGNRLRIRTDDNNNGNSCRSHLVILDPDGEWFHNRDIADTNRNAQINLGSSQSGTYHIWVGRDGSRCPTNLVIEKY